MSTGAVHLHQSVAITIEIELWKLPECGERADIPRGEHAARLNGAHRLRTRRAEVQNPPNIHPCATEIIYVTQGVLEVGFITTAIQALFAKTLTVGEVFVFPRGLVHFQQNRGNGPASVIAAFNSQLQGTQVIANTLFAAEPPVPSDVLAKAFRIGNDDIDAVKAKFK
ncbi:hypothetical protein ACQ4PT_058078 [Festuca glaucescens]